MLDMEIFGGKNMNKSSRAVVWSLYDDIKREVMDYHMRILTEFNAYRTNYINNYSSGMKNNYLEAGRCLNKLLNITFVSGAWDKYDPNSNKKEKAREEYVDMKRIIRNWFSRRYDESEKILDEMLLLEDLMEQLFEETHFYDITADTGESRSINIEEFFQEAGL